jgi:predicted RND superfamily exporter protein
MIQVGPGPRARAFVDWTLRWGRWLWALALALAVPAALRTARLYAHLRGDIEALLPRDAPSVVAADELRNRLPGLQHLGVVVDAGDASRLPAAERLVDDLARRIRSYPPELVRSVRTGNAEEEAFVEAHAPLYMDLTDLRTVLARVEARRDWEVARREDVLLDDDDPPPPLDFADIQRTYDTRVVGARGHHGRFSSEALHTTLMLIQVGDSDTSSRRDEALLRRVKADLAALDPSGYAPGLRVGFTGDVAIRVEETAALVSDLTLSSAVVLALEVVVVLLYFRWWRALVLLLAPLLVTTVLAFVIASLPPFGVTELNSNTAFLGSIIVGNGVNFGIVLLGRYVEERRRGAAVKQAMEVAIWGARPGTAAAALAAGVSYASLALTDFQGFRQFGLIGGIGMLLSWLLAFVLTPPLALWIDRASCLPVAARKRLMPLAAAVVERHCAAILVAAAVMTLGAALELRKLGPSALETDFSTLRRADTWTEGEGYWGRRMDALLQAYVTPIVIMADDGDQARAIGRHLAADVRGPPLDALVSTIRTLDDALPGEEHEKLAVVEQIREAMTPRIHASLDQEQRRTVDRFLGTASLHPITASDLPPAFTTGLRERDGTLGRELLVYPHPGHALWEGPKLTALVEGLRDAAATVSAPGERPGRVAGSPALSSDILGSVRRGGAMASGAAFLAVVILVLLVLRRSRSTLLVLGSLLLGVLWLLGAQMALGVRFNFANFIAYPITFGIGVDYAVNVASRWELDGRGDMGDAIRTTGGAVALCSLTTIIGYSSLLLAENRALFLFGLLAVLGELTCLSTAVLVMPALVTWLSRGRRAIALSPVPGE